MKSHAKRVMGLDINKRFGHLMSISEDGKFKTTDLKTRTILSEIAPGKSGLKYMKYLDERDVIVIADGDGFVHIYHTSNVCI